MANDQQIGGAKAFLIVASICSGLLLLLYRTFELIPEAERVPGHGVLRLDLSNNMATTLPLMFVTFLLYPVVGAGATFLCSGLRYWAHMGSIDDWDKETTIIFTALWPLTLAVSIILYPSLGLINRIFGR